jgi:hypothetical protein
MRYIGIIILLVLCLTLLLLTGSVVNTVTPETAIGNLENQENTEEPVIGDTEETGTANPQKWSGLTGFDAWYDNVYTYGDIWLANGFTEWRGLRNYTNTGEVNGSKAAVIAGNTKGLKAIWGVGSGGTTITSTNWANFRAAILSAATWAQANGVYEFQLGNEEEWHVDGTTMTVAQLIINLKDVATDVQAIFTNGNVSYTCAQGHIDDWITAGKGDIDILASNVYIGGEGWYPSDLWETRITNLVNAFGVNGTYLTEFAPSSSSLDDYSANEAVQVAALTEMIEYIKTSGMIRALFYCWKDDDFGVVKTDDSYRLLWSQALLNSGSVKFATVPTKTTTVSLPDTITLIPRITR